ncbi:hypothetical protein QC761_711460 [Podospora bellae-mahoneyi]|uniref:DNA repair protein RAD16 n=1 Tax=Podospora bellae-mahoneyi TaxID=2093777 RepID=A0ABR0F9M3_9PEZI|nr:hypothetical protein QC761_711460 [Podospora bellae-mahoneyi]
MALGDTPEIDQQAYGTVGDSNTSNFPPSHTKLTFAPVVDPGAGSGPKKAGKKGKKAKKSDADPDRPPKNAKEYWQQHYARACESGSNLKREAVEEPYETPSTKIQRMSGPDDKSEGLVPVKTEEAVSVRAEEGVSVKAEEGVSVKAGEPGFIEIEAPVFVKAEGPALIKTEENTAFDYKIPLPSKTAVQAAVDDALQTIEDRLDKGNMQACKDFEELREATLSFGVNNCKPVEGKWKLKGFKTPLYNHQLIGVRWMCSREFHPRGSNGGILADEMGLGKTVQLLACISQNPPSSRRDKAQKTLIIAPEKLLTQWYREIFDHCDDKGLRVLVYKNANAMADAECANSDIIITNYAQVQRQASKGLAECEESEESEEPSDFRETSLKQKLHRHGPPLFRINYHRIVLDEAHAINNRESSTSLACRYLTGKYRWVLTGTPLTNTTAEVFPYLDFLGTKFKKYDTFVQAMGGVKGKMGDMEELQKTLEELTLRRRVDTQLMGAPIFQIPKAHPVQVVTVNFSPFEMEVYGRTNRRQMALEVRRQAYQDAGQPYDPGPEKGTMQKIVDHLQFFTSHPALVEPEWYEDQENQDKSRLPEPSEVKCNCFCRYCRRVVTPASKLADCGHLFCASCFGNLITRHHNKEKACCPSCNKPVGSGRSGKGSCPSHHGMPILPRDNGHTYRHFGDDDNGFQPRFSKHQETTRKGTKKKARRAKSGKKKRHPSKRRKATKANNKGGKQKRQTVQTVQQTRANTLNFMKGVDSHPWDPVPHSAKTKATLDLIDGWQSEAPEDKIMIFVQWIPMLSILGRMLTQSGYRFVYFWGDLDQNDQEQSLKTFRKVPAVKIMLASITCTAHGLNLTVANRAIMYDHWWNVCRQQQAFGRVHRIGQTKEVHTAKIVVAGSVDERIIQIQQDKETAISGIMDGMDEIKKRPISMAKEILGLGDLSESIDENADMNEDEDYYEDSDDEDDDEEETDSESESTSDESGSESGSGSGSYDDEDDGEHSGSESD